jgi:hypothetical protein
VQEMVEPSGAVTNIINQYNRYQFIEIDEESPVKVGRRWFSNRFDIESEQTFNLNFPNIIPGQQMKVKVKVASASETSTSMAVSVNGTSLNPLIFSPINDPFLLDSNQFSGEITSGNEGLRTWDYLTAGKSFKLEIAGSFVGISFQIRNQTGSETYKTYNGSQSFNEIIETAMAERFDFNQKGQQKIPLFGYKSKIDEGRLGEIEKEILSAHNLDLEEFDIKEIPYLRIKGDLRNALVPVDVQNLEVEEDELNDDAKKMMIEFNLPKGVYATTFLENFFELRENNNPIPAQL